MNKFILTRCAVAIWLAWVVSLAVAQAEPSQAPLELVVLGSGGPGAGGRASSSYLALIDQVPRILIDAGSGAFARLGESKLSIAQTNIVLLTHLHIDHAAELPGLFKARAVSSSGPISFQVFGPSGSQHSVRDAYFPSTSRFMDLLFGPEGAFAYLRDFSAPITIEAHDIAAPVHPSPAAAVAKPEPRVILKESGLNEGELVISAIAGHHGDAPAVIYRIDYAGKSVTFSGDIDRLGIDALALIAKGSDLLVFNSVVLDPPGSPAVLYGLHTPPHAIGKIARQANVGALLLSHLSPATEQAQSAVLRSIGENYAGPVRMASDGLRLLPGDAR